MIKFDFTDTAALSNQLRQLIKDKLISNVDLIDYLNLLEKDDFDWYKKTCCVIALGERQSIEAIEPLLDLLNNDGDLLNEQAMYSLKRIAETHPEEALNHIKEWIFDIINTLDSAQVTGEDYRKLDLGFSGRVYAYGVVESMAPRGDALQLLFQIIEQDWSMGNSSLMDLLNWDLSQDALLAYFRRHYAIAVAKSGDDSKMNHDLVETKWAMIHASRGEIGKQAPFQDQIKPPSFSQRVKSIASLFRRYEIDEEDNHECSENENKQFLERTKTFELEMVEEKTMYDDFTIPNFVLSDYLKLPIYDENKESMQQFIDYLDFPVSVSDLQIRINRSSKPSSALTFLDTDDFVFDNDKEAEKFFEKFQQLWNITPREEFDGLSPTDRSLYSVDENEAIKSEKIGRNDPCPCGVKKKDGKAMKYKKCCGK